MDQTPFVKWKGFERLGKVFDGKLKSYIYEWGLRGYPPIDIKGLSE